MSPHYRDTLDYDTGVRIVVDFTVRRREVLDYAVQLRAGQEPCFAWRAAISSGRLVLAG
jgi:hypothetical protein